MNTANAFWRTIPRKSFIGFLLGVFFIFSAMGFAHDTMQLGRQSIPRYVLGVLLSGLFAVSYAASFIVLRKRFWKWFLPVFVTQFLLMGALGYFS